MSEPFNAAISPDSLSLDPFGLLTDVITDIPTNLVIYNNMGLSMPYNGTDLAKKESNYIGDDIITGEIGILTGGNFVTTINLLNSAKTQDNAMKFFYSHLNLDGLFSGSSIILNSNQYLLTNGLDVVGVLSSESVEVGKLPIANANIQNTISILNVIDNKPTVELYSDINSSAGTENSYINSYISLIGTHDDNAVFSVGGGIRRQ